MAKSEHSELAKIDNEVEELQEKDKEIEKSDNEAEENGETRSLPQFQYDRKHMYELSKQPVCQKRPNCLTSDHVNTSGVWDPEKWFRSNRGESPVLSEDGQSSVSGGAKRISDNDGKIDPKKRAADPKERIKEESRDDIVLSPQRRSFGTGCHVTSQRRLGSPIDAHDMSHKESVLTSRDGPSRRIGSGRLGNRSNTDRQESDREYGYKAHHREFGSGRLKDHDRDRPKRQSRNHRMAVQEEPEWYSEGPASQSEFIELRGFEEPNENEDLEKHFTPNQPRGKNKTSSPVEKSAASKPASISTSDKNGSLETNESSSPSNSEGTAGAQTREFDVNELFKLESLPGFPLMMNAGNHSPDPERVSPNRKENGLGGSRFSQWRNTQPTQPIPNTWSHLNHLANQNASARDDFISSLLEDESLKAKSGLNSNMPSHQRNILEILQNANIAVEPKVLNEMTMQNANLKQQAMEGKVKSVEELEAGLKQLVFGGNGFEQPQNDHMRPGMRNNISSNHEENSAFNKLINSMNDNGSGLSQTSVGPPIDRSKAMSEKQLLQDMLGHDHGRVINDMHMKKSPVEQDILNRLLSQQSQQPMENNVARVFKPQEVHRRASPSPQDILASMRHPAAFSPGLLADHEIPQPQNQSGIQQREMLMSLLKQQQQQQQQQPPHQQQPVIQPQPASPIMGHLLIPSVGRLSPSNHSPLLQDNYQQQQRVPSPLLFSQQPPIISHAPSPIHPAQSLQGVTPQNTLQVQSSPTLPRVPSPQELIARTQAIYHNALIQKKVEEQRGNFRRKQELQQRPYSPSNAPSPNPAVKNDAKVTMAAFMPTSVMRKMHSDAKSGNDGKNGSSAKDLNNGGGSPIKGNQLRPLHGQGVMNTQGISGMISQNSQIPTIALQNEVASPPRPIIKANSNSPKSAKHFMANSSSNDLSQYSGHGNYVENRNVEHHSINLNKIMEQQHMKMQMGSPQMFRHQMPPPPPPNMVGGPPPPHQLPPGLSPMLVPANFPPQTQQQASTDMFRKIIAHQNTPIRGQSNMGVNSQGAHQSMMAPTAIYPRKMAPNAQSIHHLLQSPRMAHANSAPPANGQTSMDFHHSAPDLMKHGMKSNSGAGIPANLSKWFGSDILKQNLSSMPQVPTQKALSLEEVERQQQVA